MTIEYTGYRGDFSYTGNITPDNSSTFMKWVIEQVNTNIPKVMPHFDTVKDEMRKDPMADFDIYDFGDMDAKFSFYFKVVFEKSPSADEVKFVFVIDGFWGDENEDPFMTLGFQSAPSWLWSEWNSKNPNHPDKLDDMLHRFVRCVFKAIPDVAYAAPVAGELPF